MRKMSGLIMILFSFKLSIGQTVLPASPCLTDKVYRQFDFWIGNWEAFNLKGQKAGDSKISLILDSCVVLEEWTSAMPPGGFVYKGKSFNTYNAATRQWQQNWVDNTGGVTNYSMGKYDSAKIIFLTDPVHFTKDSVVVSRLTFYNLGPDKVRQLGEVSNDNGLTWITQYDLEYRRKK